MTDSPPDIPPETPPEAPPVTRLAPSPTGALHLGNARTFLINWAMARQRGWRVLMRIEDLDTPRTKGGADQQALEDCAWLGMDWDDGPVYQAEDLSPYHEALDQLKQTGDVYPCNASRKEIEAASAPNEGDHETRYPGMCRPPNGLIEGGDTDIAWRLLVPDGAVSWDDRFMGQQAIDVQATAGDFVVHTKAKLPAYQLAVVVDDDRQGVTEVVRADDLVPSTGRQLWVYRLLGWSGRVPRHTHVPLVRGSDGRRLAKRHGDSRLSHYRALGVPAQRVIGLMACWCGVIDRPEPMTSQAFVEAFELERVPRESVIFTQEQDAWLLGDTDHA